MCSLKVSWSSKITPRFLTEVDGVIIDVPNWIEKLCCRVRVAGTTRSSVFAMLCCRWCSFIHAEMSARQPEIRLPEINSSITAQFNMQWHQKVFVDTLKCIHFFIFHNKSNWHHTSIKNHCLISWSKVCDVSISHIISRLNVYCCNEATVCVSLYCRKCQITIGSWWLVQFLPLLPWQPHWLSNSRDELKC